ncbi:MAG TPA: hypothetical protein VMV94_18085 [Phycisphaerae bacterium]|nr:hypothetical protein [Phycisphaerae bacterium]
MSRKSACICLPALSACLAFAAAASATPINYGDFPAGSAEEVSFLQVTEDSAVNPLPLFDEPVRVGNKLLFFPTVFAASAADGTTAGTTATLTMSIQASPGYSLRLIKVSEIGDCTLLGAGTTNTAADIYGFLGVIDTTPGTHGSFADTLQTAPAPPFTLPKWSFTEFEGHAQIDLTGLGISQMTLAFTDTLEATSEAGTTAFIQKKFFGLEVTTIPEPASGLLMAGCLLPLLTRGRLTRRP